MAGVAGMLARLGIHSASPVTAQFDFVDESLSCDEELIDGNGLRGTLSSDISRVRTGIRRIQGGLTLQPNSVEWSLLLPWILGTAGSGSPTITYALADELLSRYVAIDRIATSLATYDTVMVDKATISGSQNQPIKLVLDLVGKDETITGSFPSLSIDVANGPFVFHDCVISVGGTTITPKEFSISIDNKIDRDRFFNSQTLSSGTKKQDRVIMFSCSVPYGDFYAIYGTGAAGLAVVVTATNGSAVLTFTLAKVAIPRKSATVGGRQEVMLPLSGRAYANGSTKELVTQLVIGP